MDFEILYHNDRYWMHSTLRLKGLLIDPNNAVFHFPFYVNPWMKLSEILGEELPCHWLYYKLGYNQYANQVKILNY